MQDCSHDLPSQALPVSADQLLQRRRVVVIDLLLGLVYGRAEMAARLPLHFLNFLLCRILAGRPPPQAPALLSPCVLVLLVMGRVRSIACGLQPATRLQPHAPQLQQHGQRPAAQEPRAACQPSRTALRRPTPPSAPDLHLCSSAVSAALLEGHSPCPGVHPDRRSAQTAGLGVPKAGAGPALRPSLPRAQRASPRGLGCRAGRASLRSSGCEQA